MKAHATTHNQKKTSWLFWPALLLGLMFTGSANAQVSVDLGNYNLLSENGQRRFFYATGEETTAGNLTPKTWSAYWELATNSSLAEDGVTRDYAVVNPERRVIYRLTDQNAAFIPYRFTNVGMDNCMPIRNEGVNTQLTPMLTRVVTPGTQYPYSIRFDMQNHGVAVPNSWYQLTGMATIATGSTPVMTPAGQFADTVAITFDETYEVYGQGQFIQSFREVTTKVFARDVGLVMMDVSESRTENNITFDNTYHSELVRFNTGTGVVYSIPEAEFGIIHGTATAQAGAESLTLTYGKHGAQAFALMNGVSSHSPVTDPGGFNLFFRTSNSPGHIGVIAEGYNRQVIDVTNPAAVNNTNFIMMPSVNQTGQYCDDIGAGTPCQPGMPGCEPACTPGTPGCEPACTPGTPGCEPTCTPGTPNCPPIQQGSGIHMRGRLWYDANGNGVYDAGEGVAGKLDVTNTGANTNNMGFGDATTSGDFDIDLPQATGSYEIDVLPPMQGALVPYMGGVFLLYIADNTTDGWDGSADGGVVNQTLVAVNGADVIVNIQVKLGGGECQPADPHCGNGGGPEPGRSGIHMRGTIWTDKNGNAVRDNDEGIVGWVNVFESESMMWSGAYTETGDYDIDLPSATGTYEVGFAPDNMSAMIQYVGGVFLLNPGDNTADGYDGSATGNWEKKDLIAIAGQDVTVNIEVRKGITITGFVRLQDGTPVSGFGVYANSSEVMNGGASFTGEDGAFTISVMQGPGYDLYTGADLWSHPDQANLMGGFFRDDDGGFASDKGGDGLWLGGTTDWMNRTLIEVPAGGVDNVVIVLNAGTRIHGRILTEDGAPVRWQWVEVSSDIMQFWGGGSTDFEGVFSVVVPPGEGYRLAVWPQGGAVMDNTLMGGFWHAMDRDREITTSGRDGKLVPEVERATLITVVEDEEINVILKAGNSISGRVTDTNGTPVPYLWVEANNDQTFARFGGGTDEDGNYKIAIPPGAYRVQIWGNGIYQTVFYNQASRQEDATPVNAGAGSVTGIDFTLSTGAVISGNVTGLPGNHNAWISAWSQETYGWAGTNVAGEGEGQTPKEFTLNGLIEGGGYVIDIWADGFRGGSVQDDGKVGMIDTAKRWQTGATDANIELNQGKTITGTITGLAAGEQVWINVQDEVTWAWAGTEVTAVDNSPVAYSVTGVKESTVNRISVHSEGYGDGFFGGAPDDPASEPVNWDQATILDTTNNGFSGINILMTKGHTISGVVTGLAADGRAWINTFSDSTGSWGGTEVIGAGADAVAYTIYGLKDSADFRVNIWSEGYQSGFYSATGIANWDQADFINSGSNPTDINFTLSTGKTISGTITGLNPGEWGNIDAWSQSTNSWGGTNLQGAQDGSDLTYTIAGLATAADFVVNFRPGEHAHKMLKDIDSSTDPTGIDFVATQGKSITGTISIVPAPDAPTWVYIDAYSQSTFYGGHAEVFTDANGAGTFTLTNLVDADDYILSGHANNQHLFYKEAGDGTPGTTSFWNEATPLNVMPGSLTGKDIAFNATVYDVTGTIAGLTSENTMVWINAWSEATWMWGGASRTGNGTFTIPGLPGGSYKISIFAEGYNTVYYTAKDSADPVFENALPLLVDGSDDDIGTIDMAAKVGYNISGKVTNSKNEAEPSVWIQVSGTDFTFYGGARTNSEGEYTIEGLPDNHNYKISAWSTLGYYESQTDVHLSGGNATHDIQFGGAGTGSLTVGVTQGGSPVEGAMVILLDKDGTFVQAYMTGADGRTTDPFEGLATDSNDYTVRVDANSDGTPDKEQSATVVAGQAVEILIGL